MLSHRRFSIVGARNDFRPAKSRIVERVYGEVIGELWDHPLKQIQLGTDLMQQDQRRALAGRQIADLRTGGVKTANTRVQIAAPTDGSVEQTLCTRASS